MAEAKNKRSTRAPKGAPGARFYRRLCRVVSLLSTFHRRSIRRLLAQPYKNRMWMVGEVFRLLFLPRTPRSLPPAIEPATPTEKHEGTVSLGGKGGFLID